jgi:histidinol-phosphatase (PHP family)
LGRRRIGAIIAEIAREYRRGREIIVREASLWGPRNPISSLHTHSHYCDGEGEIREYIEAALVEGVGAFGASGHAPLPFPCDYAIPLTALDRYCTEVRRLAEVYADRLPVYLGIELDYLPGLSAFYEGELLRRDFDYLIASVHYVAGPGGTPWTYDESAERFISEIQARYGGDARPVVEDYYRRVCSMVDEVANWGVPAVVGHLDRIRLWNRDDRFFPTSGRWYEDLVETALAAIQRAGLPVELNTSGWAKPAGQPNPDLPLLRRCAQYGIPVLLSSDAHRPRDVAARFDEGMRLLGLAGIREIAVLSDRQWKLVPLSPRSAGPL